MNKLQIFIIKFKINQQLCNLRTASKILKYLPRCLGARFHLRGMENISADKSAVIVANHQSMLDVLGMFGEYV